MNASALSNLSPKHLTYISQQMIDEGFNSEIPYEEYEDFANKLGDLVKYFGEKYVSRIDIEFLASFINYNDKVLTELFDSETQNKQELYGKLIIPKPVEYTFDVLASGRAFVVETYKHRDISYNPEWFFPMIDALRYNSDEFEYYNVGGINIPLHELNKHIGSLPENKKLIFCCQTGQRSKMAIQVLKLTYKGEMYHLKNGIT
jgi:rhodanese-related sulfurtransferase